MKTVWKYPLRRLGPTLLAMPEGAQIVQVGVDGDNSPCLWALVNPALPLDLQRRYTIHGTGAEVDERKEYVGTFFELPYVWHVFMERAS